MITNVTSRIAYDGDGGSVNFAVPYKFFLSSDLKVVERVIATGADTVLTEGVEYTVTGGGGASGTVVAATAPAATVQWIITRTTSRTQQNDYVNDSALPLQTIEDDLDRNAMRDIEVDRELTKSLRIPESDDPTIGQEIPNSVDRASKYLGFDSDGQPIAVAAEASAALVTPFAATVLDDADAATARATLEAQKDVITARGDLIRGSIGAVAEKLVKGPQGSLLRANATDVAWLALGIAGEMLKSDGGDLVWAAPWDENAIINGCCRVGQRAAHTLVKDTWGFGIVDRMEGMATGTLVSAGVLTQDTASSLGTTGYAAHFDGMTLTGTGILYLRHRIEHKNAVRFIDGPATFKCQVLHDVGSDVDFTITVRKADVADDFSATTEIDNDGGTAVVTATGTTLTFTIADMGSCGNGIEIEIKMEVGAITTKDVHLTELQLVPRLTAPPFSWRSYEDEYSRCKRYFQLHGGAANTVSSVGRNAGSITQTFTESFPLIPEMRIAPTLTKNGDWKNTGATADPTFAAGDGKQFIMSFDVTTVTAWDVEPDGADDTLECDAEF